MVTKIVGIFTQKCQYQKYESAMVSVVDSVCLSVELSGISKQKQNKKLYIVVACCFHCFQSIELDDNSET